MDFFFVDFNVEFIKSIERKELEMKILYGNKIIDFYCFNFVLCNCYKRSLKKLSVL